MPEPKTGTARDGQPMHYSVGAVIKADDKYLLMDRAIKPFGFAGPAGHVDLGEDPVTALYREVAEETGLKVIRHELVQEGEAYGNECNRGVKVHYWYLYRVWTETDDFTPNREAKTMGWYSVEEIKKLDLEPVWEDWFKLLGVI